ncbi:MAG: M56 family metallopeptidase [Candidatus Kerfeldbacteria bacterium]|nr:M56 family metallopeptidase [Candidatus Kerfeldbacteria bacterium]
MMLPLPSPGVRTAAASGLAALLATVLIADRQTGVAVIRFCTNVFAAILESRGTVAFHLFILGLAGWIGGRGALLIVKEAVHRLHWAVLIRTRRTYRRDCGPDEIVLADSRPFAFTAGWLRPASYFSTALLDRLSREERAAVRLHERAHRRRRDPLRLFAWNLVASVLPFFPLLREFARAAATDCETAADHRARADGAAQTHLLNAIRTSVAVGGTMPRFHAAHLALPADLLARVRVLNGEPDQRRFGAGRLALTAVALAAIVLPALTMQVNADSLNNVVQCEAPPSPAERVPISEQPMRPKLPANSTIRLIESRAVVYPQPQP